MAFTENEATDSIIGIAPILERMKSKNKHNFIGDYLSNFEKNLIPINISMQQSFKKCVMVMFYWFRIQCKGLILPQNVDIVVSIFYTLPQCAGCGMYNNLWLNLCDGYIGCGRPFWNGLGGKGCALKHYMVYKEERENDINESRNKLFSLVVKLGTINKYGADVFDYAKNNGNGEMVMEAVDGDGNNEVVAKTKYRPFGWDKVMSLPDLKGMLSHWGVEMGVMYKFDKTMQDLDVESNQQFISNQIRW